MLVHLQNQRSLSSDHSKLGLGGDFLPTTMDDATRRGWSELDVVMVTGDAYVDHPAFGPILIARLLAKRGLRVAVLAQPDWRSVADFRRFGRPKLFFGVSAGNVDSMLNRLTAQKQNRSSDPYSPGGRPGQRPDRATLVYANRCREAFPDVPIILGGIEASLRRIAHYDYWSDSVRRPILVDAKADLLVFGMGESPILEISERLQHGEAIDRIRDVRGTALLLSQEETLALSAPRELSPECRPIVELPAYEEVVGGDLESRQRFALMSRQSHEESNRQNGRPLLQRVGHRAVYFNPPALPLTEEQLDALYDLPFTRRAHPSYHEPVPAYEVVKHSLRLLRGCASDCSFCCVSEHEGRIVQRRSTESIERELTALQQLDDFHGGTLDRCVTEPSFAAEQAKSGLSPLPAYISGHPGSTLDYTIELALYLKAHHLRPPSVQDFIPTPMSLATAMYYTGLDPLSKDASHPVFTERGLRDKKLQRALLMYWDRSQHDLAREALHKANRRDLIGHGPGCLVPPAHSPRHDRSLNVSTGRGPRTPVRHGSLDHAPKRPASRPLPTSPEDAPQPLT